MGKRNICCKVEWEEERPNDDVNDLNDGYLYGYYIFDCIEEDYDKEQGYGAYDIIDAQWFKTTSERDEEQIINKILT